MTDLPRATQLLRRGIRLRCPRCGHGPLFRRYFSMSEQCSVCALTFEREPGYFVGAIYLNYAATVLIAIPGYLALYQAGLSLSLQLVLWGAFCILFPLWFLRYSKSLWLAMDYFFDPGETSERDAGSDRAGASRQASAAGNEALSHDHPVRVECYSGSRGEETPRRLWAGDRWEDLTVFDRWVSESIRGPHRTRCFRVRLAGGRDGLLYHDDTLDAWFWRS